MLEADARTKQIEAILEGNWTRFDRWRMESGARQTLAVPLGVTDVFIPRRLLELSQDPNNLRTISFANAPEYLRFMIVEWFEHPISDPSIYAKWQEEHPERHGGVSVLAELAKTPPEGVDYKHILYDYLVEDGILSLHDRFLLQYNADLETRMLTKPPYPDLVESNSFLDRPEQHRQGIGTSFYQRLEAVLKRLGFRYLSGVIVGRHPDFYSKTRTRFGDLPEDIQNELSRYYVVDPDLMIRIL